MNAKPSFRLGIPIILFVSTFWVSAQCWFNAELYSSGNFDNSGTRSQPVLIGTMLNTTNRGYLAFRLPRFAGTPESAALVGLRFWTQSPLASGTLQLREVIASPASVCDYVTNGPAVFRDLGEGRVLGAQDFTNEPSDGPYRQPDS